MIKPKSNILVSGFFSIYIRWIIKRHFCRVAYNVPVFSDQKSILLVANHFSWWDGFLLLYINQKLFKKKFHIMVLEETVKKFQFFRYLGAFSVALGSKGLIKSIDYAVALLNDSQNIVVIFPQGKLYSNFIDEVHFHKGAAAIASRAKKEFDYVFAATFIESLMHKKPTVQVFLKSYNSVDVNITDLQNLYQHHYSEAKQQQTSITV